MRHKNLDFEVLEAAPGRGRIRINSAAVDREHDRVFPRGARIENYMKNPIVQWGHNYRDPWATIGRTIGLEIADDHIDAEFELRPPANEGDPQNVVRLLWEGGFVNTASVGFNPVGDVVMNEFGGFDFKEWDLMEWSLVPVPANQEALRLAVRALPQPELPGTEHPALVLPEDALEMLHKIIEDLKRRF